MGALWGYPPNPDFPLQKKQAPRMRCGRRKAVYIYNTIKLVNIVVYKTLSIYYISIGVYIYILYKKKRGERRKEEKGKKSKKEKREKNNCIVAWDYEFVKW